MMLNGEVEGAVLDEVQKRGKKGVALALLCGILFPGEGNGPYNHNGRRVDRALQKLRKAGKIHYYSPNVGWRPGKATPEALGR
jgi:hypothetical protein